MIEIGNIKASMVQSMGDDAMIAQAARVSTDNDDSDKPIEGLIRYLGTSLHTSPFEHTGVTYVIDLPIFTRDQWVRHRTFSYNALSMRYSLLDSEKVKLDGKPTEYNMRKFYIPPRDRPVFNHGTSANPDISEVADGFTYNLMAYHLEDAYHASLYYYQQLASLGIANELARMVIPNGLMTRIYVTGNLLNWARFVKTRSADNAQWEIKQLASGISDELADLYPLAWPMLMVGFLGKDDDPEDDS